MLLRASEVPRTWDRQGRPPSGAPINPEERRRPCRGVPGRCEDGRGPRMAVVWDAEHVPSGRFRDRREAWDERRSHAKNDCASTPKETLIAGLQYSALRAGRSAGRSLSWHGRGRGFKSHPVHFREARRHLSGSAIVPDSDVHRLGFGNGTRLLGRSVGRYGQ